MSALPMNPPTPVAGLPTRLTMGEVATVNTDGTVDVKSLQSRAMKAGVPVVTTIAVAAGQRVLLADLDGDPQRPVVIGCLTGTGAASAPTGPAGGVLAGTYPNPAFASDMATQAELDAHASAKTGVHGIPTMASGQGLVWNGTTWAATDLATQAELDTVAAAKENTGVAVPKSLVDAKGDLLVASAADTVARLAVGADGAALVADSTQTTGVKWLALSAVPALVTSLPTGTDGLEVFYLADSTNGIIWRLRYRSASGSTYKWEFVGGTALAANNTSSGTRAGGTGFGALTGTSGPSIVGPLAGDYEIDFGARITNNNPASSSQIGIQVGATSADDDSSAGAAEDGSAPISVWRSIRRTLSAASTTISTVYRSSGGTATFAEMELRLRPVRVG